MTHELYYTSVPRGLQPGKQGFCTVAATKGLSPLLQERLEALSGYKPVFPPHDPQADRNPVAFAHHRLTVAGRTYSVLSRVCFAGIDYSGRTNKFAHHVVLEASELPLGGPAWLAGRPGFLETIWLGEPRQLPAGRMPPRGDQGAAVCRQWERITGDAGWAGVLVEAQENNRPAYIIFEPGMDLLPLLTEALALLPASQRWNVTFSTYYSTAPMGVHCQWRCVLKDSQEAHDARRVPGAVTIDLTSPLGMAVGGLRVEQARTGKAPAAPATTPPPLDLPEQDILGEPISHDLAPIPFAETSSPEPLPVARAPGAPPPLRSQPERPKRAVPIKAPEWLEDAPEERRGGRTALLVGLGLLLVVAGIAVGLAVGFGGNREPVPIARAPDAKPPVAPEPLPKEEANQGRPEPPRAPDVHKPEPPKPANRGGEANAEVARAPVEPRPKGEPPRAKQPPQKPAAPEKPDGEVVAAVPPPLPPPPNSPPGQEPGRPPESFPQPMKPSKNDPPIKRPEQRQNFKEADIALVLPEVNRTRSALVGSNENKAVDLAPHGGDGLGRITEFKRVLGLEQTPWLEVTPLRERLEVKLKRGEGQLSSLIARFESRQGRLSFAWGSGKDVDAESERAMRNAVVEVVMDGRNRWVALRPATGGKISGSIINEKGTAVLDVPLDQGKDPQLPIGTEFEIGSLGLAFQFQENIKQEYVRQWKTPASHVSFGPSKPGSGSPEQLESSHEAPVATLTRGEVVVEVVKPASKPEELQKVQLALSVASAEFKRATPEFEQRHKQWREAKERLQEYERMRKEGKNSGEPPPRPGPEPERHAGPPLLQRSLNYAVTELTLYRKVADVYVKAFELKPVPTPSARPTNPLPAGNEPKKPETKLVTPP